MSNVWEENKQEQEEWRSVTEFPGKYEVSSYGRVRSIDRFNINCKGVVQPLKGKLLKSRKVSKRKDGCLTYPDVPLGFRVSRRVHRLVAIAFVPNPFNYTEVNHLDGNKYNNHYLNLKWVTRSENMQHAADSGLWVAAKGSNHGISKLTEKDVRHIRDEYYYHNGKRPIIRNLIRGYGVSKYTIYNIVHYKSWIHVR